MSEVNTGTPPPPSEYPIGEPSGETTGSENESQEDNTMSEVNPVTEPETNENETEETTPVPFSTAVTFNLGKFDESKLVKTEMVDENGYWKTTYGYTEEEEEE